MIWGGSLMSMFTTSVSSGLMPLLQVTVKLNAPVAVGVPVNAPVEPLSERPAGKVPAVTDQVNVAGVPVAVKVWLYGVPSKPSTGAALVIVGASLITRLQAWVGSVPIPLVQLTVKAKFPVAVGVPESMPVVPLSDKPVGNEPAITDQVTAGLA